MNSCGTGGWFPYMIMDKDGSFELFGMLLDPINEGMCRPIIEVDDEALDKRCPLTGALYDLMTGRRLSGVWGSCRTSADSATVIMNLEFILDRDGDRVGVFMSGLVTGNSPFQRFSGAFRAFEPEAELLERNEAEMRTERPRSEDEALQLRRLLDKLLEEARKREGQPTVLVRPEPGDTGTGGGSQT